MADRQAGSRQAYRLTEGRTDRPRDRLQTDRQLGININRHAGRPTNRQTDRWNKCSCVSAYIQTQITLIDSSVGDVINITTMDFISKDTFLVPNIALADLGNQVRFSIPLHENSNPESPERPASVLSSALSRLPTRKKKA